MSTDVRGAVAETTEVARSEATNLTQTAGTQTREVLRETTEQARSAFGNVQEDLRARANEEASKFARSLHDAGRQMQAMAQSGAEQPTIATNLMREGAHAAERLASRLDEGGVDRVAADIRSWARRNPGGFLLGAGVVGFAMGRLARNMSGHPSVEQRSFQSGSRPRDGELGAADGDARRDDQHPANDGESW